jgi:hypothetical protein
MMMKLTRVDGTKKFGLAHAANKYTKLENWEEKIGNFHSTKKLCSVEDFQT